MKKIIIASVIAFSAIVSQAVSVNWSANALVDANGKSLLDSAQYSSPATAVATFWAAVEDGAGGFKAGSLLGTSDGTFSVVGGVAAQWAGSWKAAETKTSYFTQLVITDKDGNSITSEQAMFTTTTAGTYAPNFSNGSKFVDSGSKFSQTGANYGWTMAAPEPTSGMLLLIGVAGLALRRRRT